MIINIRGISGSGKSTLARKIMGLYDRKFPIRDKHPSTRKAPIGYLCQKLGVTQLGIVGHYESACGGADTIHGYDILYPMILDAAVAGNHVLYEGLLISGDVKNTRDLVGKLGTQTELRNVALRVPLEECMESVTQRRIRAWETKGSKGERPGPMPLKRAQAKQSQLESAVRRLNEADIPVEWADRDEAFELVRSWLGI
jgi:hypothetical protein